MKRDENESLGEWLSWILAVLVAIACMLLSLAGLYIALSEGGALSEGEDAPTTTTIGVYDKELDAYCSIFWGSIPEIKYTLEDDSVIYITKCADAAALGIVTQRNTQRAAGN